MFGDDVLENLLGFVGTIERVEVGRHLDLGVARQRRTRRHALIGLDREIGLFQLLVEVAERQQRHRLRRLEIKRELQIDQRKVLAAAAADRGPEPVERLGGAGLSEFDERRQLLAFADRLHLVVDDRMVRQLLREVG